MAKSLHVGLMTTTMRTVLFPCLSFFQAQISKPKKMIYYTYCNEEVKFMNKTKWLSASDYVQITVHMQVISLACDE